MQNQPLLLRETKYCRLDLPQDFPILCMEGDHWCSSYQTIIMVHFHNCLQIGYCYEGNGYSLIDGTLYPYEAGHISIIPAKILHHCISQPNTLSRWKWIYLDLLGLLPYLHPDYAKVLMPIVYGKEPVTHMVNKTDNPEIILVAKAIIHEMENRHDGYKEVVRSLIQALMLLLLRISSRLKLNENKNIVQSNLQIIAPAIQHISMYYMNPLTVPELAELCHISATHLRRTFKRIMNCSPLDYLQQVRLQAACVLLLQPDISVTEAGSRVGFSTDTSFTRQFKKIFQTTPGKWRFKMMNSEKAG